ncbi:MAG: bifunctional metallophosphatase/5'-nucleotidase [Armatimonadetes bacterium]|nr:bifunctional metallophosphatase/5'-nucleotidase [Armatimonadota bacterium]
MSLGDSAARFVLLHTADLHNRLSPAAAHQLRTLKAQRPGTILLDAGDAVAAGNLTLSLFGEPILRRMAEAGYDAITMGNRESHPCRCFLVRKLRDASFPVLAANLMSVRQPLPQMVRSHIIVETPNGRVAVFGLTRQMTPPDSIWAHITDYVFEDPLAIARNLISGLRPEADLVVGLSHCGQEVDMKLAAMPEIDLVLGGHSHADLVVQEQGSALVVHPGSHGSRVAVTEITSREQARSSLIPLESGR